MLIFLLCGHTERNAKKIMTKIVLLVKKFRLPLQRYPENNLFTLKKTNTY